MFRVGVNTFGLSSGIMSAAVFKPLKHTACLSQIRSRLAVQTTPCLSVPLSLVKEVKQTFVTVPLCCYTSTSVRRTAVSPQIYWDAFGCVRPVGVDKAGP